MASTSEKIYQICGTQVRMVIMDMRNSTLICLMNGDQDLRDDKSLACMGELQNFNDLSLGTRGVSSTIIPSNESAISLSLSKQLSLKVTKPVYASYTCYIPSSFPREVYIRELQLKAAEFIESHSFQLDNVNNQKASLKDQ